MDLEREARDGGSSFRRLTSAAPGATPPPAGAAGAAPCGGAKFGMACCGIICIGIAPVVCSGMAPPPPIWSAMVARCLRRCKYSVRTLYLCAAMFFCCR